MSLRCRSERRTLATSLTCRRSWAPTSPSSVPTPRGTTSAWPSSSTGTISPRWRRSGRSPSRPACTRTSSSPATLPGSTGLTGRPTWSPQAGQIEHCAGQRPPLFWQRSSADMARRALETFAVAKWPDTRLRSKFSFTRELPANGDFNMPLSVPGDPIFGALTKLGLEIPDHSSQIASSQLMCVFLLTLLRRIWSCACSAFTESSHSG